LRDALRKAGRWTHDAGPGKSKSTKGE